MATGLADDVLAELGENGEKGYADTGGDGRWDLKLSDVTATALLMPPARRSLKRRRPLRAPARYCDAP